ncbi:polysaccharide lyase [Prosthecobacter sp.]|uniref:polysaccharide lyase n=1 Tax=Prosthecobacter sp. TaxID=1965333 RepID=UPI00378425CD
MNRWFPARFARLAIVISAVVVPQLVQAAAPQEVSAAITKAVAFYHSRAAAHGGYVYRYSADFTLREAEGIPGPDTIWIQPPGTPAVGMAMLDAYEATKDEKCLAAAVAAAHAVTRTQLASGGWDYSGHFDAKNRASQLYRRDGEGTLIERKKVPEGEGGWHVWKRHQNKNNYSTFDDDVSQAATRLLVRVDHALGGKDAEIKEAADFALNAIMATQYPAGGWSANWETWPSTPPPVTMYPVKSGSYPADWPRTWPKDFTGCYVLNDNTHATLMNTLLLAWTLRGDQKYLDAAKRGGDFLVTAQMPDPQPAWAQQYDADMHPSWSRAFEPSAICGRESQAAMWALLKLAAASGDKKYLAPLPRAIAYLRKSQLPDGRIARYYELQTNKPLYFERGEGGKGFVLTYSDKKASSNYGWKWGSELDTLESFGRKIYRGEPVIFPRVELERWSSPPTDQDIATILKEQKPDGSWAATDDERGVMRDANGKKTKPAGGVIYSLDFVQNVKALCASLK